MSPAVGHERPALHTGRGGAIASLAAAMLGGVASIWTILDRGWVPFDEGTLGQAAERVLHGQLPHRDFTDPYTGGLAGLHALAMRLFGVTLMAPRYALFIGFVLWLPALWWLAMRWCGPRWAVAITIIGAWWSLPIYPAAMPSWYLLFIGTWIVVALERWQASKPGGRVRWLVLAGGLCGVAVLVKQTGLYLVAGTLLGILSGDQADVRARWGDAKPAGRTDPVVVILLAFLGACVLRLMWGQIASGELLSEILPIFALLTLAALREWRLTDDTAARWKRLLRYAGIVLAAAAIPVALFLVPYASSGSLGMLYTDAIGEGAKRISTLHWAMRPALLLLIAATPVYAVLALELLSRNRRVFGVLAIVSAVALLWFSITTVAGYLSLWFFGTSMLPVGVGLVFVVGYRAWRTQRAADPVLLMLAGITAFQALNQFPFAAPTYFAYVAPLAILTAFAAAAQFAAVPRLNAAALILAGFAGIVLRVGTLRNLGFYPLHADYTHRLAVPRGGLRVTAYDSSRYKYLLDLIAQHRGGGTVYAGPELPEVYFLSGQQSPGRDSYSLFASPVRDSTELPRLFGANAANVIVIKRRPLFSPPLADDVYAWLSIRYPLGQRMDTLEVRWRRAP
jgi:hypothetical protein